MLKKVTLSLTLILAVTIFTCTVIALERDEFQTFGNTQSPKLRTLVFIPPKFETPTNDTSRVAENARNGYVGNFVKTEHTSQSSSTDNINIFRKVYRFFAIIGYTLLSFLGIFYGKF